MSWLSRNTIIYGCIAVASTASVLYLIQRRRKKPQLAALMEEASDLNYFMDSNQDRSFNQGFSAHFVAPAPYISSQEVEDTVSMVREIFEGRYDAALNESLFQRSCRRLFDRFSTGRLPPTFDHPMERSLWETMMKHLVAVADGIHDPAVTQKQSKENVNYDLYADIGTLFVCAALFSLRPAFSLPIYGSEAQWRQIKMHITAGRIEKLTLPAMRWPYWFKLALKNPKPSDRSHALYFFYLWRFGHVGEAQQVLEKATSYNLPNCSRLYAIYLAMRGDVEAAKKLLQRIVTERPEDIVAVALQKRIIHGIEERDLFIALFETMAYVHVSPQ